jgi:hypothetical protein
MEGDKMGKIRGKWLSSEKEMVRAIGIEPTTPTVSSLGFRSRIVNDIRASLQFLKTIQSLSNPKFCFCPDCIAAAFPEGIA